MNELQKLGGISCVHQNESGPGCSVHEQRPQICRAYRCLWLKGGLPEENRPDRLGAVLDIFHDGAQARLEIRQSRSGTFENSSDLAAIAEAPWFAAPEFVAPSWNGQAVLYMIPVAIAPAIEHFGDIIAIRITNHGKVRGVGDVEVVAFPSQSVNTVESVSERFGLIRDAIVVAVDEYFDGISGGVFFGRAELRTLRDERAAKPVERDAGRVADQRFTGKETDLETIRQGGEFGFVGVEIGCVRVWKNQANDKQRKQS